MRLAWAGLAAITIAAVRSRRSSPVKLCRPARVRSRRRARRSRISGRHRSRRQDPRIALERLHPADGYEVNLFASEQQFLELANPLAMTFDDRGRLWVLVAPTYPHLVPGQKPDDKLVVLEDTDRDAAPTR
jgi:hypothetical protein